MNARAILLLVSIVSTGMMAGLFFGWMVSVIPGLRVVDDGAYVATMQSINVKIVNPAFVIPFVVTPVLLAIAGLLEYRAGRQQRAGQLWASALTYVVGVLAVTAAGNIPLNNALDAFDPGSASPSQILNERTSYEGPWNKWHLARTIAASVAFGLAAASAIITETGE